MLYHVSVGSEFKTTLRFHLLCRYFVIVAFVVVAVANVVAVFHRKMCVSIIFNSFLDEASNLFYRILTNHK